MLRSERKGFMTPASLVDLNLDGKPEAIVVGFDGFVVAVDISTRKQLWNFSLPQAESYRSAGQRLQLNLQYTYEHSPVLS